MKKLLLATSILSATAGIAAAEVSLSGDARMGIISEAGADAVFTSRARVSFGLSGESDSGLSFGASFRADNAGPASAGNAGSVYISGAFGKLSMGDVDSADKAAVGQLSGVGLTGLGDSNELEYSADGIGLFGYVKSIAGAPIVGAVATNALTVNSKVLYTYSAGGFTAHGSLSQLSDLADSFAIGGAYAAGDLTVAAGYGKSTASAPLVPVDAVVTDISASVAYAMGGTTVKGVFQNKTLDFGPVELGSADSYGLSVDHKLDALTLTAFAITSKVEADGDKASLDRFGLGASYDLGGGASVVGGVARADGINWTTGAVSAATSYDLGVSFAF